PQTDPAPVILHANDGGQDSDPDGIIDNDSGNPYQPSWWINRFLEIFKTLASDLSEFRTNPADAISDLLHDIPLLISDEFTHAEEAIQVSPQFAAVPFIAPSGFAGGIAGISLLAGIQPDVAAPPTPAAVPAPMPQVPSAPAISSAPVVSA